MEQHERGTARLVRTALRYAHVRERRVRFLDMHSEIDSREVMRDGWGGAEAPVALLC